MSALARFNRYLYIFVAPGMDGVNSKADIRSASFTTSIVGVSRVLDAPEAAVAGVAAGAQVIELCGAFGPADTANVVSATQGRVPVGAVSFPLTDLAGLQRIFG